MRAFFGVICGAFLLSGIPLQAQTRVATVATPVVTNAVASAASSFASLPSKPRPRHEEGLRQQYIATHEMGQPALGGAYESEPSLEERLSIEAVRTPFLSESTYFITHLWKGLDLDGFDNTIHAQNSQLGWLASSGYFQVTPPSNHDQASLGTSSETYGVSLRYTFKQDREKGSDEPKPVWRRVSSLVTGS